MCLFVPLVLWKTVWWWRPRLWVWWGHFLWFSSHRTPPQPEPSERREGKAWALLLSQNTALIFSAITLSQVFNQHCAWKSTFLTSTRHRHTLCLNASESTDSWADLFSEQVIQTTQQRIGTDTMEYLGFLSLPVGVFELELSLRITDPSASSLCISVCPRLTMCHLHPRF